MKQIELLNQLIETIKQQMNTVKDFDKIEQSKLIFKPNPEKWNVVECLEHLNLYTDFYLNEFEVRLNKSTPSFSAEYKPGWLGNYFANSMLPKEKANPMKTFKDKNPKNLTLQQKHVLNRFLQHQAKLIEILEKAKKFDINKTRSSITISKLLTLRLGDAFRFLVNHQTRHFHQIENLLSHQENI